MEELLSEKKSVTALVVILTDGYEHASREFKAEQIRSMIKTKEEQGNWSFLFVGATVDTWIDAESLGMQKGNVVLYKPENTGSAMTAVSKTCVRFINSGVKNSSSLTSYAKNEFKESDSQIINLNELKKKRKKKYLH